MVWKGGRHSEPSICGRLVSRCPLVRHSPSDPADPKLCTSTDRSNSPPGGFSPGGLGGHARGARSRHRQNRPHPPGPSRVCTETKRELVAARPRLARPPAPPRPCAHYKPSRVQEKTRPIWCDFPGADVPNLHIFPGFAVWGVSGVTNRGADGGHRSLDLPKIRRVLSKSV